MHKPWEHTQDIAKMFQDGRVTDRSVTESLRKSLEQARALEILAKKKGISIIEPFAGIKDRTGQVYVLGPTVSYYESLLPEFRCTPRSKSSIATGGLFEQLLHGANAVKEAIKMVLETWNIETLKDDGVTSAENNSSAIIAVHAQDGHWLLFTADAGIPALTPVADVFDAVNFDRTAIKFVQIPHHGSRRNVRPTLLNQLLNPIQAENTNSRCAFVSVAKDGAPKHPAKKVTNAFTRRGCRVLTTGDGYSKRYHHFAPARTEYVPASPLPIYYQVEESDSESE